MRILPFVLVHVFISSTCFAEVILSEIESHENAVHIMDDWMRDPFITIGPDGVYYLSCTQFSNEAEGEGFPMWRSDDLVNWKWVGIPFTLRSASNYEAYWEHFEHRKKTRSNWNHEGLKLWAPEIHWVKDRWVMMYTSNVGLGNLVFSNNPVFSAPFYDWGASFGRRHDPSIFVDEDDSKWLVTNITVITRIKDDWSGLSNEVYELEPSDRKMGHEGAYIIKIDSKYVLFGTAWSTDKMRHGTYNLYYATADHLKGPYSERRFAGRFLGHGTPFQDLKGRWWCTAFHNANVPTLNPEDASKMDLTDTAYTINKQGLTLVPLDVKSKDGDVWIRAKDPAYRNPGSEEVQQFDLQ